MVAAAAAKRFPRGVADPGAARAFVHDRAGTVLALDLATGQVRWRAGTALRPLSVVGDVVVAARIASRNAIELVMLDAGDGHELRASEPLALPDWAQASLDDTPDYALRAEAEGGTVVLRWAAQARYRGGAPPSARPGARPGWTWALAPSSRSPSPPQGLSTPTRPPRRRQTPRCWSRPTSAGPATSSSCGTAPGSASGRSSAPWTARPAARSGRP